MSLYRRWALARFGGFTVIRLKQPERESVGMRELWRLYLIAIIAHMMITNIAAPTIMGSMSRGMGQTFISS